MVKFTGARARYIFPRKQSKQMLLEKKLRKD